MQKNILGPASSMTLTAALKCFDDCLEYADVTRLRMIVLRAASTWLPGAAAPQVRLERWFMECLDASDSLVSTVCKRQWKAAKCHRNERGSGSGRAGWDPHVDVLLSPRIDHHAAVHHPARQGETEGKEQPHVRSQTSFVRPQQLSTVSTHHTTSPQTPLHTKRPQLQPRDRLFSEGPPE